MLGTSPVSSEIKYQAALSPATQRFLATCSQALKQQLGYKIYLLQIDPRREGAIKLANAETYRYRVGDYRIIYEIKDDVLILHVVDIGHRREVYR
jgi:mRNA interferase RelE/StbE